MSDFAVGADEAAAFVAGLFAAGGLPSGAAAEVAEGLVEASRQGLPSHGLMQVESYLDHLLAGTVSAAEAPASVTGNGALTRIDAGHMFGHVAGRIGMEHALRNARTHGIGAAAVAHSFHFGAAGRYAEMAARENCIGIAMANSRAVMAPPGASEPLVGTNPLAIAIPAGAHPPIIFDMATSAGGVAKIVLARQAGEMIPEGWALDADGNPTTDPVEALAGSLLPAAGVKGFGLSLCIDVMTALLADGVPGTEIGPMRAEALRPMDCSFLFIAIDIAHLREMPGALAQVDVVIERVQTARQGPGGEAPHVPGARKFMHAEGLGDMVMLSLGVCAGMQRAARKVGRELPDGWAERAGLE